MVPTDQVAYQYLCSQSQTHNNHGASVRSDHRDYLVFFYYTGDEPSE